MNKMNGMHHGAYEDRLPDEVAATAYNDWNYISDAHHHTVRVGVQLHN